MWKDCTMIKKIKETDWWEVSYLIIYAIIFSKEFLQTTMFPIQWPLGLGYVFALMSGGYVILKFLFHNTYNKKEMILAALVLIAFCVPAFTTDYTYLFWTGCLIVGAKDVDFNKILKVYLVIGITIMVVAFAASQGGVIEDLVYETARWGNQEEIIIRHSYGIVYPTDFAAHIFYMVLAFVVYMDERYSLARKLWVILLATYVVYYVAGARTSVLCLLGFAGLCLAKSILGKCMRYVCMFLHWVPVVCAVGFIYLSSIYSMERVWLHELNMHMSMRFYFSKQGLDNYPVKLFGQNIQEIGGGLSTVNSPEYFFLDDAYISILLKYGILSLVVVVGLLMLISIFACKKNRQLISLAIVAIAIHSIMEHHLISLAYNPMLLAMFAMITYRDNATGGKYVQKNE